MLTFRMPWPCAAALVFAIAPAACGRADAPLSPDALRISPLVLPDTQAVTCVGETSGGGTMTCGGGDYADFIVANVAYNSGTGRLSFDAAVTNRIGQPLGTTDGASLDPSGVRVFFQAGPTVTAGTGSASVIPDGFAAFTASGQPYYQYDEVLSPNETSAAKAWTFILPPTVAQFVFTLRVSAAVPFSNGWIDVTGTATANVGGTRTLTATRRDAAGTRSPREARSRGPAPPRRSPPWAPPPGSCPRWRRAPRPSPPLTEPSPARRRSP